MPVKTYTAKGNYDLTWDSDKLTATVNGKIYNVIKDCLGDDITEAERRVLAYTPLASYNAREVYTAGVGRGMDVVIHIYDYEYRNNFRECSYTLSIGEQE